MPSHPASRAASRRRFIGLLALAPFVLTPLVLSGGSAWAAEEAPFPAGKWLAEDIRGGGVIDKARTMIEITPDGRVSGSGGCNRIGGGAMVKGDSLRFSRMVSTRMACAPALMDQERRFLQALEDVRRFHVDSQRDKLLLRDARGKTILRLSRM